MSAMLVVGKLAPPGACVICGRPTPSWFIPGGGKRLRKTCSAACFSARRSQLNREAMTTEKARAMAKKRFRQPDKSHTGKNSTEERRRRGLEQAARRFQKVVERRVGPVG